MAGGRAGRCTLVFLILLVIFNEVVPFGRVDDGEEPLACELALTRTQLDELLCVLLLAEKVFVSPWLRLSTDAII